MAKRQTEFPLESVQNGSIMEDGYSKLRIMGNMPKSKPYLVIETKWGNFFVKDKDLKRLAVNIFKSLGKSPTTN